VWYPNNNVVLGILNAGHVFSVMLCEGRASGAILICGMKCQYLLLFRVAYVVLSGEGSSTPPFVLFPVFRIHTTSEHLIFIK
jgi:hypothetical protein